MEKFKYWYLTKCISLCNYGLGFSDAADDQEEVNRVIETKNYFIRKRDKLRLTDKVNE